MNPLLWEKKAGYYAGNGVSIMKQENNLLPIRLLFERLSIEIYHGFNMRMILNDIKINESGKYQVLIDFICKCKSSWTKPGKKQGIK